MEYLDFDNAKIPKTNTDTSPKRDLDKDEYTKQPVSTVISTHINRNINLINRPITYIL